MEQNNIETLEEVEVTEMKDIKDINQLKEYEKLLIAEAERADFEKALNLVKFGCFEQKKEDTVDFSNLELIAKDRKYRGLYNLYRDLNTMQLILICPLVENNKGDKEEVKDMKPYAYDCIYIETMDEETYQMVCKAAKNNISNKITFLYRTSFIVYFILLAITAFVVIFNLIQYGNTGFWNCIGLTCFYSASFISATVFTLPLLVLISIKYKSYKEQ